MKFAEISRLVGHHVGSQRVGWLNVHRLSKSLSGVSSHAIHRPTCGQGQCGIALTLEKCAGSPGNDTPVCREDARLGPSRSRLTLISGFRLRVSVAILKSIPGIGATAAAAILIECPEIDSLGRKQIASLTGLAPMTRHSGQRRGTA
ncbi:MAG: transposase, partial [Pseudomonadota bacterium]